MTEKRGGLAFRNPVKQQGWAMIYHVLTLDQDLSDGAFRLYVLLLMYARQADGCWPGRERLAKDLGASVPTVDRRLSELVKKGLITRQQRLNRTAMTWIEDLEDVYASVPIKNDRDVLIKNDRDMSLSKMIGKEETEEETDMKDDGVLTTTQQQSLSLLTSFGVTHSVAKNLATNCDLESVEGWIDYAQAADGLHSPIAFVVSKLSTGDPVPPAVEKNNPDAQRKRYLQWLQQ